MTLTRTKQDSQHKPCACFSRGSDFVRGRPSKIAIGHETVFTFLSVMDCRVRHSKHHSLIRSYLCTSTVWHSPPAHKGTLVMLQATSDSQAQYAALALDFRFPNKHTHSKRHGSRLSFHICSISTTFLKCCQPMRSLMIGVQHCCDGVDQPTRIFCRARESLPCLSLCSFLHLPEL